MINQPNHPPHATSTNPNLIPFPSLSLRDSEAHESMLVIQENQSLRYQ